MIYFCSPYGTDDGSSVLRSGSFEELSSKLEPGDILHVLPGIYACDHTINMFSKGTEDNPVYIIGDENEKPIFDFRHQQYGENGIRIKGEYLIFKNIIVRYAGFKGVRSDLSNSVLENIESYGCCDSGIQMSSGGNNKIIKCVSHHNFGYKTIVNDRGKFGFHSDGISDKLHDGPPNYFEECESYNNTDDGFDFFGRITKNPTVLKNCISHDNGQRYFNMIDYPRYDVDREWFDQFKNGKEMVCKSRNPIVITLSAYPAFGNGDGFKLGGKHTNHNVDLYECNAYCNKLKNYDRNGGIGKINYVSCHEKRASK